MQPREAVQKHLCFQMSLPTDRRLHCFSAAQTLHSSNGEGGKFCGSCVLLASPADVWYSSHFWCPNRDQTWTDEAWLHRSAKHSPAQTEGQDRLCSSPAIMNGACLHCQMDASAKTPTLSTARGGKSKRFIIAHASQFRTTHLYHPGAESKLLSWTL